MYAATGGKLVAWAMVGIVAACAAGALLLTVAAKLDDPIVRTREIPAPALSSSATVADVRARFKGAPVQSVPGEQLGLEGTCDVYVVSDGGVLLCHA